MGSLIHPGLTHDTIPPGDFSHPNRDIPCHPLYPALTLLDHDALFEP